MHARESCANSEIKSYPCFHCIRLGFIKFHWVLRSAMDLSFPMNERKTYTPIDTYWGMMALNLARLTTIFGRALRHTDIISHPMFSPSLSQSVQIINVFAVRASVMRFLSMVLFAAGTVTCIGASNRINGSQELHCLYASGKSCASRCPATAVTVKVEFV